ncbi:TetR/AcrR family transcriptional regulator [Neobacillus rhizophilus]|uniref:TetR family transcriptional regulator n=1 Tax=Neobacillus rhizophilus TaxID=2833579 RepID=A0A942U0Y4_9BACI|nr:TetR family transcriptional regulator [Neobacillus rhizophilus]MBS4211250.1 TetR family transcriptional regulator [Neobacillus rhizophilus]MBU8918773.1 TetR family transcriptional regulator [Bacillus sp. FJAT-29953]
MPKQTFFHLPKDKQDTLIQSARKEFSRVPLHEASIANIIKDAGIPRGSFYQYFEDKEDLFYYLLSRLSQINYERFVSSLNVNNGDLFDTFIDSFQLMIKYHRNPEHQNLFKNAFLNMNYKLEKTLANNIYEEDQKNRYLDMVSLINTGNLNIKDEQELHHVIKIITAVTFHNLVQMFVKDLTDEEALQNYQVQLDLIKRGLYKEEPR